jgi:hypothetical protein
MGGEFLPALVQSFPARGQQIVYCHCLNRDTTGLISLEWMSPPLPLRYIYEEILCCGSAKVSMRFRIHIFRHCGSGSRDFMT